ncbi:MAG TPA: hypothetical protein VFR23_23720 [Jiangellaceae bacterium]|nr:hypothetical protein [Jiangellaceae bacterium]
MSKTTTDPKPLYAVAGVADLAVAALRELTARLPVFAERAENAAVHARTRLADRFSDLPADLDKLRAELPTDLQKLRTELPADLQKLRAELPVDLKKLRVELPTDVQKFRAELPTVLSDLQAKALKYYGELATRGEGAVARFRRDHADTIQAVTARVAGTAEKAADAADQVAEDLDAAARPEKKPAKKAATVQTRKTANS